MNFNWKQAFVTLFETKSLLSLDRGLRLALSFKSIKSLIKCPCLCHESIVIASLSFYALGRKERSGGKNTWKELIWEKKKLWELKEDVKKNSLNHYLHMPTLAHLNQRIWIAGAFKSSLVDVLYFRWQNLTSSVDQNNLSRFCSARKLSMDLSDHPGYNSLWKDKEIPSFPFLLT